MEHETCFLFWVFHSQEFQTSGKGPQRCVWGAPLRVTHYSDFSVGGAMEKGCSRGGSCPSDPPTLSVLGGPMEWHSVLKAVALLFNFLSRPFPECSTHECPDPSALARPTRSFMSRPQHSFPASSPAASLRVLCHWPQGISHFPQEEPELRPTALSTSCSLGLFSSSSLVEILLGVQARFRAHHPRSPSRSSKQGCVHLCFAHFSGYSSVPPASP